MTEQMVPAERTTLLMTMSKFSLTLLRTTALVSTSHWEKNNFIGEIQYDVKEFERDSTI
jgi:hypothetical protein